MQYYTEPAKCPNCGKDTHYNVILSYSSFMKNMLPSNKCSCGYHLSEEDIDLSKASPSHRESIRDRKIYKYIDSITKKEDGDWKCENCGCTKSSAHGFTCTQVPEEYKDDERVTVNNSYKVCSECGHETREPFESYSDSYDLIKVLEDGSFLCRQKNDYEDKLKEFFAERKRQYEEAEQYLMSIGEITTIEYEDEYADKYYGKHFDRDLRRMMRF